MKRIISAILVVLMLTSILPLNAFAYGYEDVVSIEASAVEVIKNYGGGMMSEGYWDEQGNFIEEDTWFFYDIVPDNVAVTFADGTQYSGTFNEVAAITDNALEINTDQSYENPWDLGVHTASINLYGFEAEFTVTVVETPVASMVIEPIECIKHWMVTGTVISKAIIILKTRGLITISGLKTLPLILRTVPLFPVVNPKFTRKQVIPFRTM